VRAAWHIGTLSCVGMLLSGCAVWLHDAEGGRIEIKKIKDAIDCELAAVSKAAAQLPRPIRPDDILAWRAKSTLDMTLVASIGADGNVTYILRTIDPLRIIPSAALSGRETNVAHVEFATTIAGALKNPALANRPCEPSPDPSGTGMGLAAWFMSTLLAVPRGQFAGGTFTTEFEVAGSAAARFGWTLTRVAGDAGGAGKLSHTHRLSVAFNTPPTDPPAVHVIIDGDNRPRARTRDEALESAAGARVRVRAAPAHPINDPRLNRQLDNVRPLTLEPGAIR
jgi:hypothetical protein